MTPARPLEGFAADPLGLYRRGLAQSHRGELLALQTLAAARDGLRETQDEPFAALAAAALLITGQCMSNYRRFREHAAALAGLRDGSLHFADHEDDLVAQAGLLCALLFLSPSDDAIDACVTRIMALLELDIDVNVRFAAGRLVLYYTEPREMRELGQRVYGLLRPLAEHPDLTPHRLGRWLIVWSRVTANAKDPTQHRRARAQAHELAERHREPEVAAWNFAAEIEQGLRAHDFALIERALASIESVSDPNNLSDMRRLSWLKGRFALAKGEGDAALFHAERARRYADELELPPPMLGVLLALEAQAKVLVGDYAGAREQFECTSEIVAVLHAEEMRDMIRMVDAYEACELRRPDARALLVSAFAAPRARQFYDTFDTNPPFGATMCALALEQDVEVEFVRRIIEVHGMAVPANAGSSWPWPIRILTLGGFELSRASGAAAVQAPRTQKRPLELVKALIALGGREVGKSRLADLLWPEVEPDAAAAALDMAVSRLRKLLAQPNAIRIEDGRIGFDPDQVWVDVWAFDRDVEALQSALRSAGSGNDDEVAKLGQRLLSGYRGAFLEDEEPQRWMLAPRDRWRSRFLRSLADAGRYWERHERWSEAIELYERGIEVETLAEELYRQLMHCHLAQGQPAQAARVYRQCRETLSVQLGTTPSTETEALFKSIYKEP
jgi:LuxR family transcriptional regulator, maltose regulon positive regulatory protein